MVLRFCGHAKPGPSESRRVAGSLLFFFVGKYCKSDACLIVREARESPHTHSFLELLKFQLLAGDGGTYRPVYERWFTPTGRLMTFITSCPHTRAPAFPSAKSSISAYQMSVTVFLLLLDFCSSPGSTLIPGTDCNSPRYGFPLIPRETAGALALRATVECQNLIGSVQNSQALRLLACVCLFLF